VTVQKVGGFRAKGRREIEVLRMQAETPNPHGIDDEVIPAKLIHCRAWLMAMAGKRDALKN
jgi:hypothetical protein